MVEVFRAPKKVSSVSTALPVVSLFALLIPSILVHKKVEEGLAEMETNIFGNPRKQENTKIGLALLVIMGIFMAIGGLLFIIAGERNMELQMIAGMITAPAGFIEFILLYWIWKSSCRQRDRLLILAEQLGLTVIDTRGVNLAFGCFGTWLWWLFLIMGFFTVYVTVGPFVRQYRTTAMFNEVVHTYNQYAAD